jgi:hypothetical protein
MLCGHAALAMAVLLHMQVYKDVPADNTTAFQEQGQALTSDPAGALGNDTVNNIQQSTGVDLNTASAPTGFSAATVVSREVAAHQQLETSRYWLSAA